MSVTSFPMMRLKLPGGGLGGVGASPTLKLNLSIPQALKFQFLPAIPGSNVHGKVNRSGDTMGGSLILDHDPLLQLEAATKQYVDFVGAAGVTPGDKGDITVGGGGGWTIDNDVVTYAKMQNISAAGLLLGRGSASGAGDPAGDRARHQSEHVGHDAERDRWRWRRQRGCRRPVSRDR